MFLFIRKLAKFLFIMCLMNAYIFLQPGSDGRRLLALKFVAAIILIYTPDPNGSTELPTHLIGDGNGCGQ